MLVSISPVLKLGLACILLAGAAAIPINPSFEGTYELDRTKHDLSITAIFVFIANGVNVPVLSDQVEIPTSVDPNNDQWLDDLETLAGNLKTGCENLGHDASECEDGAIDVSQAIYDVNKWLVERLATKWSIDILPYNAGNELVNLFPIDVEFTYSVAPVAMLQPGLTFTRPTSGGSESTEGPFSAIMNRQGVSVGLGITLGDSEGGVSNGGAALAFTYNVNVIKGQIFANQNFNAKGEYGSILGIAVGATKFGNFGIGVNLAVTWEGETNGVQTSSPPPPTPAPVSPPSSTPPPPTPAPASPPPPIPVPVSPPSPSPAICFSGDATVQLLKDGAGVQETTTAMKHLEVGDHVWTGDKYEQVYAFGHFHQTKPTMFRQIYTDGDKSPLELSGEHMVFVHDKPNPIRAVDIKVNDVLQSGYLAEGVRVTKIKQVEKPGLYAPFTPSGRLVVNGVMASNYVSLQPNESEYAKVQIGFTELVLPYQTYIHLAVSPFRLMCTGISSNLCGLRNADGMPYYLSFAIAVYEWIHKQNRVVQALVYVPIVLFIGLCVALETCLGPTLVRYVLLVALLAGIWKKNRAGLKVKKA